MRRHFGEIGPNAIIQTLAVLKDRHGAETARACATAAGIADWVDAPPSGMVPETPVAQLFQSIRDRFPTAETHAGALESGRRTSDYIYTHRIPGFAKTILRLLPSALGIRLLSMAIAKHAWTFAGSARFDILAGTPRIISLAESRLPPPADLWYAAVFETLYRRIDRRVCVDALPPAAHGTGFDYRFAFSAQS